MVKFTNKFAGQYPLISKPDAYSLDEGFIEKLNSEIYKAVEQCGDMEDEDISALFGAIFDFYGNKLEMGNHCMDLLEVCDISKLPESLKERIGELAREAYEYMPGDDGNSRVVKSFIQIYRRNPGLILPLLNDLFPIGAINDDMAQDARSQDAHWEAFYDFLKDSAIQNSDYRILKDILKETVSLNIAEALPCYADQQAHSKVARELGLEEKTLKHRANLELDAESYLAGKPRETPLTDAIRRAKDSSSGQNIERYAETSNFIKAQKLAAEMLKKLGSSKK